MLVIVSAKVAIPLAQVVSTSLVSMTQAASHNSSTQTLSDLNKAPTTVQAVYQKIAADDKFLPDIASRALVLPTDDKIKDSVINREKWF